MRKTVLVSWMLLALAFAGCVDGGDTGAADGGAGAADALAPAQRVQDAPPIDWSVAGSVDWWEHVSTSFPKHDANTPTNAELRRHLVAEMEAIGFDVEVRSYAAGALGQDAPEQEEEDLRYHAIVATRPGTELPDRRIGLVSHYDTQAGTVHGAYDDKSGVAVEYSICKAMSDLPLRRTLTCIFFDAEERGLEASDAYVEDVITEGDEDFVYDFVLGYDMTGINWPGHDWKMYVMTGDEEKALVLQPFAQELMHDVLGYPEEGVEVLDVHDRNSDEMNFKRAGVPILRFAGGRDAVDYPGYHQPFDTVEYVYLYTDGRANFEAGFATVVEASYTTILALDATDYDELQRTY